jgi:hypothetical protein
MRSARLTVLTLAILAVVLVPLLSVWGRGGDPLRAAVAVAQTPPLNVPKADCGSNDRVETGLQGQTTPAERDSGAVNEAFNCNLEPVGQFQGEGAGYGFAWFDDCAYYDTANTPQQQHRGTVVVDVSDPRHPQAIAYLDTPTMLDPHESLKVHKGRKLLAGVQNNGTGFAIYDVSDCRHPILKASIEVPGSRGHAGNFTPDGMTYYATQNFRGLGGIMPIIDVSDPSNPKHLLNWQFPGHGRPHDVSFNEDGTRLYATQPGRFGDTGSSIGPNGLVILDVSDIQFRRPNPQIRVISTLFWEDGGQAQQALPVTYRGRPHLIFTDERGAGGVGGMQDACARGLPPSGFPRIIDISDETNPKTISKLMLEVDDPANCPVILSDPPDRYTYSSHYCNVDATVNPTMLACSYRESAGLRVFDISDPVHPKEIAYYKPPAQRTAFLPGSVFWRDTGGGDRTTDQVPSNVRFRKHRGEQGEKDRGELWFTSQDSGFQIVRFTNGVGSPRCFDPGPRGCAANE